MIRRPPRSTRPDTLFPYTTLFRSRSDGLCVFGVIADLAQRLFDFVAQCLRLRGICRLAAINGTGDQLFGNRQLLLKYLRLLALSQQAQGQYVRPGLVEQRLDETRDFFSFLPVRSEEPPSAPQLLMRITTAAFSFTN